MAPGRLTPRSAAEWGAVLPTWISGAVLVFLVVFWAATGRVESALLTTFGGVFAAGQGVQALAALRSAQAPPPVPELDPPSNEEPPA